MHPLLRTSLPTPLATHTLTNSSLKKRVVPATLTFCSSLLMGLTCQTLRWQGVSVTNSCWCGDAGAACAVCCSDYASSYCCSLANITPLPDTAAAAAAVRAAAAHAAAHAASAAATSGCWLLLML
jgi:hypothetical protein